MKVIHDEVLGARRGGILEEWRAARPINVVVIDDFADGDALRRISAAYPEPANLNKSRDFVFARNKFEKNRFADLGPDMAALYDDLLTPEFAEFLSELYGRTVFVDPQFHGGGLHMGGAGSYLDMHADFNVHPLHDSWQRELNVLLYLNENWKPEHRGQLKLRNAHTGETREIEPLFNRCVIMLTKKHTLHGYDALQFPPGTYRKSIASYAYSLISPSQTVEPHSTLWYSETSRLRRAIGPYIHRLVRMKNALFGSGSARNR